MGFYFYVRREAMTNLSTKELAGIEDQLSSESTVIKKFKDYATTCKDPALKSKYEQIASRHQQHYNKLLTYLG